MSKDPVIWLDDEAWGWFKFGVEMWLYILTSLLLVWASLKGYIPPLRLGP